MYILNTFYIFIFLFEYWNKLKSTSGISKSMNCIISAGTFSSSIWLWRNSTTSICFVTQYNNSLASGSSSLWCRCRCCASISTPSSSSVISCRVSIYSSTVWSSSISSSTTSAASSWSSTRPIIMRRSRNIKCASYSRYSSCSSRTGSTSSSS